jgi:hypothetical protein
MNVGHAFFCLVSLCQCRHCLGQLQPQVERVKVTYWEANMPHANLPAALLDGGDVNAKVLHVTVLLRGSSGP